VGHIVEYRGSAIRSLSMEGRMTGCNMSIEAGARAGMGAPDETTFTYLEGRPNAPIGSEWDEALDDWRSLPTDEGATFDKDVALDATDLRPHVSWGTKPGTARHERRRRPRACRRDRRARPRVYGPAPGHRDPRHPARHDLHRLLHQTHEREIPAG